MRVVARVRRVVAVPPGSTGRRRPTVSFAPVKYYLGPGSTSCEGTGSGPTSGASWRSDAVILRVSCSQVAACLESLLRPTGSPTGWRSLATPTTSSPRGPSGTHCARFYRWWFPAAPPAARRACATA